MGLPPTPVEQRFWKYVQKTENCWLWIGAKGADGYGLIRNDKKYLSRAHRLVWEINNGQIPKGMLVCHRCDNRACVRPDHLFLGTPKDNTQDMMRKGREAFGALRKLTFEQAREIRKLHSKDKLSPRTLANRYGVRRSVIYRVLEGIAYRSSSYPPSHPERATL
jgi:hypothetical protein